LGLALGLDPKKLGLRRHKVAVKFAAPAPAREKRT
jgi:heterodisulfide reductase subunit B